MKYSFEVWVEVHKTVEIEAETYDEAYEKMSETVYDVDMSDAEEVDDRRYELVEDDDEKPERDEWRPGDAPWNAPGMSVSDFIR